MSALVIDTHAAVWALHGADRLSQPARDALLEAAGDGAPIFLPTICIVEVTYLVEKGRLGSGTREQLLAELFNPASSLTGAPLSAKIALRLAAISRQRVPDMPDRIIAATALELDLPLLTCDRAIRASDVRTIW